MRLELLTSRQKMSPPAKVIHLLPRSRHRQQFLGSDWRAHVNFNSMASLVQEFPAKQRGPKRRMRDSGHLKGWPVRTRDEHGHNRRSNDAHQPGQSRIPLRFGNRALAPSKMCHLPRRKNHEHATFPEVLNGLPQPAAVLPNRGTPGDRIDGNHQFAKLRQQGQNAVRQETHVWPDPRKKARENDPI
jgi:hypothetical protein